MDCREDFSETKGDKDVATKSEFEETEKRGAGGEREEKQTARDWRRRAAQGELGKPKRQQKLHRGLTHEETKGGLS